MIIARHKRTESYLAAMVITAQAARVAGEAAAEAERRFVSAVIVDFDEAGVKKGAKVRIQTRFEGPVTGTIEDVFPNALFPDDVDLLVKIGGGVRFFRASQLISVVEEKR